ncbi:hypothetical protein HDU82_000128 [Entophlyctis luteolus]|nr:hypothetical protein HDU82_000128 [Entophlyctis luteolus]
MPMQSGPVRRSAPGQPSPFPQPQQQRVPTQTAYFPQQQQQNQPPYMGQQLHQRRSNAGSVGNPPSMNMSVSNSSNYSGGFGSYTQQQQQQQQQPQQQQSPITQTQFAPQPQFGSSAMPLQPQFGQGSNVSGASAFAPHPQQTPYGYAQQIREQPQQGLYGVPFNPGMSGSPGFGIAEFQQFQNSAAGQLGMQLGTEALKQGQTIVNQNINRFVNIPKLKFYFNVSNSYVFNKLRVLTFSFRQKSWTRLVVRSENSGQMEGFKPPREDLNAPDLYIPIMAFVTYVLLVGITLNARKKFEPEILGMTASTALVVIAFEVLLFKLCCYLINVTSEVPFLDLIAYCGYKFVPVLVCLILNLVFPIPLAVYGVLFYLVISYGFFMLRSVKHLVLPDSSTSTLVAAQRQQRIYLLFGR